MMMPIGAFPQKRSRTTELVSCTGPYRGVVSSFCLEGVLVPRLLLSDEEPFLSSRSSFRLEPEDEEDEDELSLDLSFFLSLAIQFQFNSLELY